MRTRPSPRTLIALRGPHTCHRSAACSAHSSESCVGRLPTGCARSSHRSPARAASPAARTRGHAVAARRADGGRLGRLALVGEPAEARVSHAVRQRPGADEAADAGRARAKRRTRSRVLLRLGGAARADRQARHAGGSPSRRPSPARGRWESDRDSSSSPRRTGRSARPTGSLRPAFLAPQALVERPRLDFRSPRFAASVSAQAFWEDPTDPRTSGCGDARSSRIPSTRRASRSASRSACASTPQGASTDPRSQRSASRSPTTRSGAKAFVQSRADRRSPSAPGEVRVTLDTGVAGRARRRRAAERRSRSACAVPSVETLLPRRSATDGVGGHERRAPHGAGRDARVHGARARDGPARNVVVWELPRTARRSATSPSARTMRGATRARSCPRCWRKARSASSRPGSRASPSSRSSRASASRRRRAAALYRPHREAARRRSATTRW